MKTPKADFRIIDQGTIIMIELLTKYARTWINDNCDVPGYMMVGKNFVCMDRRPAADILNAMVDSGLIYETQTIHRN
jgi:hypothetical protein